MLCRRMKGLRFVGNLKNGVGMVQTGSSSGVKFRGCN